MTDPLSPARARALIHQEEIAEEAGVMLSVGQAANLLGISRQALEKRRKAGSILGVRMGADWKYPELQFKIRQPLARLKDVVQAHHGVDGWVVLDSILARDTAYGNRNIVDLLSERDNASLDRIILELEEQYG